MTREEMNKDIPEKQDADGNGMGEVEDSVRNSWSMECPKCHSDEAINIACHMSINVQLTTDGTIEDDQSSTGHEWDDDDAAWCGDCDFEGTVRDFNMDKPVTDEKGDQS